MNITYKSNKLQKQLTNPKEMDKQFGTTAKKVKQRMSELKAAQTLEVMRTLPAARCHQLTNNRKGQLAIDISKNERIIFEVDQDPKPLKEDGGLDWALVTDIRIVEIEDYH